MSARATTTILSSFDPYLNWFGIKVDERPLNPYQLLGIPDLDRDKVRIEAAAERRRIELDLHRGTAETETWELIDQELQAAVCTLQDREEKAILDAGIRRRHKTANAFADFTPDTLHPLNCNSCGVENAGTRRFCIECGQALWLVCPECDQISRADEKFCGRCGANHALATSQAIESAQAVIENARRLKSDHKHQEALRLLQQLAVVEDPRLENVIQQALHERAKWLHEFRQQVDRARAIEKEAIEYWDAGDHETAYQRLRDLPSDALSDQGREILSQLQSQFQEVHDLERRIKEATEQKRFSGIGPLIDRLLMLQPEHVQATKLAHRLAAALKQSAIKHNAEGDYQKALELLEQTPEIARGDAYQQVWERVSELAWLDRQVRQSPFVDEVTVGVAERLAKLVPRNPHATEWHAQLKRRLLGANSSQPIPWAKPPQRTAVGAPVCFWSSSKRLAVSPECRDEWLRSVGILPTAFGLALQGLGIADFEMNLRPEKRQLLSNISLGRKKAITASWGIDIGQTAIKAVKLVTNDDGTVQVDRVLIVPHAARITRFMTDHQTATEVKASLARLASDANIAKERVVLGIPAGMTFVKSIRLPPAANKQLKDLVHYEAKQQFPIPLDTLYWDYHITESSASSSKNGSFSPPVVTLLATKRELADAKLELCRGLLNVDVLQSSALALHSALMFGLEPGMQSRAVGILDIGASNSTFVVAGPEILWIRSLPSCGDLFTEAISRESHLTNAQAEQVKCEPLRAKSLPSMFRVLAPLMQNLLADMRRSIEMFEREHRNVHLEQIFLAGGTARMYGLLQQIWFGN